MDAAKAGASALVGSLSAAELQLIGGAAQVPDLADVVGPDFQAALASEGDAAFPRPAAVATLQAGLKRVGLDLADAASADLKVSVTFWCEYEQVSLHWERALQQTPWTSDLLTASSVEWCLQQGVHGEAPTLAGTSTCHVASIELEQIGVGMGMMSDMQRFVISYSGAVCSGSLPL